MAKKLVVMFVLVLILVLALPAMAQGGVSITAPGNDGVEITIQVRNNSSQTITLVANNVRQDLAPGTGGTLHYGTSCGEQNHNPNLTIILPDGSEWQMPEYKCSSGASYYMSVGGDSAPATSNGQPVYNAPELAHTGECVTSAGAQVNLRTGPGTDYSLIGMYLSPGQKITVLGVRNGWYEFDPLELGIPTISGNGSTNLWVSGSVTTKVECDVPTVTPAPLKAVIHDDGALLVGTNCRPGLDQDLYQTAFGLALTDAEGDMILTGLSETNCDVPEPPAGYCYFWSRFEIDSVQYWDDQVGGYVSVPLMYTLPRSVPAAHMHLIPDRDDLDLLINGSPASPSCVTGAEGARALISRTGN